jgi:uncharacterized damage-inducible protein DinB
MNDKELFVKMALNIWQGQVRAINHVLDKLSDEQLEKEVAPTRNRGIYLLGHLTAVHDLMLPLLRFEEAHYPYLHTAFVDAPDKAISMTPQVAQLRIEWKEVNEKLLFHFDKLPTNEWFTRHANISEEDFIEEPQRNRLNVLLGRAVHSSYHRGQLALLIRKN